MEINGLEVLSRYCVIKKRYPAKGRGGPRSSGQVKAPDLLDFRHYKGCQPNAPAAFTPGEICGTHFQRLSRTQGTWLCRWEPRKKFPVILSGIDSGTVRLVAQCLNHYATPGLQEIPFYHKKIGHNWELTIFCTYFRNQSTGQTSLVFHVFTVWCLIKQRKISASYLHHYEYTY